MAHGTDTQIAVRLSLAVARLGEQDLRGWWRSHGLDRTGSYVLTDLFPRTWKPAALQLDGASAAYLHQQLLGRPSALHLFSDHLPFRRWTNAWLAEQKTSDPDAIFATLSSWDEPTAIAAISELCAGTDATKPEPLGNGLLLGTLTRSELDDTDRLETIARMLATAYLDQTGELKAPYLDLVDA